ncbi:MULTISPECIES: S-layer homology domain-containing protein [unclassified Paenibacillus]|uniref:S-layer homology domain-containing protein n=1 Tax=unclassified Paenibacillus TaxID=185978 RepID=UPI00363AC765
MKKSLSILLSASIAFSMLSSFAYGADKSSADFTDLQNLDAASKIKFDALISAGIFDGVGDSTFGLKDKMNRAQFAKAAALIFGLPVDASVKISSFSDVLADDPANGYALPYIEALKKANLTEGFGADSYNPAGEVTKEQLAAFLIRGLNKEAEAKAIQGVNDDTVSGWAAGYAALAIQLKLMDNAVDGTFGGTSAATRELLVTSSYEAKQQYIPAAGDNKGGDTAGGVSGEGQLLAVDMPSYYLTENTQAQVKGVLQEKTANGWQLGASIKLTNTSSSTVRIPDYELRVKASDGTVYTLKASSDKPVSIAPQSVVELSYMTQVDKNTDFQLTNLLWVHVDDEVYPKLETVLADAPIDSIVWHGADAAIQEPSLMGNWGAAFTIPGETSALQYAATNVTKQFTGQAPSYIIQLRVKNTGKNAAAVPDFTLSGKAEGRSFVGKRIEQTSIKLNAGEQKYINYAITTDSDAQLTAFYVLSAHSFLQQGMNAPIQFYTGRIGVKFPGPGQTGAGMPQYEIGKPIAIDSLSKTVNPQMEVALQDFGWFENDGQSYKTAVAKIKFTNKSSSTIPVPVLGADIVSSNGTVYDGTNIASTVKDVLPGMGAVGTYTFIVPKSEEANQFTFRLMEQQGQQVQQQGQAASEQAQTQQSYKMPIAQVNVTIKTLNQAGNVYSFYPYELQMDSFNITNFAAKNAVTNSYGYSYKLEMGLNIKTTDAVLADPSNPKLLFQLEGPDGKLLGSKTYSLGGDNRLMSGNQSVMFDNAADTLESPVTAKVYEIVSTPNGDARRLLGTLKD